MFCTQILFFHFSNTFCTPHCLEKSCFYLCIAVHAGLNILNFFFQSFERVLVLNITHGLSPSLCEAIESISRWKLVQVIFTSVVRIWACKATAA